MAKKYTSTKAKKAAKSKTANKYNPNHKPENMSLEEWQRALRIQVAKKEELRILPIDKAAEGYFRVINPRSGKSYSVVYRGNFSTWNYCSCPDFRTNRLGTCKHIEAVAIAADGKYARKKYSLPARSTVYLDYRGERTIRLRAGGDNESQIRKIATRYFDREMRLRDDKYGEFEKFLSEARAIDPAFKCMDDAMSFILEKRERIHRNHIADSTADLCDGLLKVNLYPYQRKGVEFAFRAGRTLIADDMGLGKTIQAIGSAVSLKKYGFVSDVWIVCPTSLKYQWKSEIEKFCDESVLVIEGNLIKRDQDLCADGSFFKIISYQSLSNNIKHGLRRMPSLIIYDEVQRLKNWDTKMSKAMRDVSSDYVIALSGTPLENRLSELYSVMQLVDQYALGPYWQFVDETTDTDATGRVVGYRNLHKVKERMESLLVRRLKRDVQLQMPARTDKTLFVPVTKEQKAIHDDCNWQVGILLARWKKLGFLPEKDRKKLLLMLSMMRMAADSTFILDQKTRHDTKIEEACQIVSDMIESGDEKVVIFSQWERMQRIMAQELERHGIDAKVLNGSVPSEKRGKLINDFMSDPDCRVFLSTDAGSTGLNLQAASIIINLDLPWNPAVLEQRIARVYRLGQQRNVAIINMVSKGTIEERMLDTLAFKTGLFEGVFDGGEDSIVLSGKKFDKFAELISDKLEQSEQGPDSEQESESEEDEKEILPGQEAEYQAEEEEYEEISNQDDYDGSDALTDDKAGSDAVSEDNDENQSSGNESSTHEVSGKEASDRDTSDKETSKEGTSDKDATGKPASAGYPDSPEKVKQNPSTLLSKGLEFLGGLSKALSTPESRKEFVDGIVKEDPATGQKSISIPVESKETVENILGMFADLITTFKNR